MTLSGYFALNDRHVAGVFVPAFGQKCLENCKGIGLRICHQRQNVVSGDVSFMRLFTGGYSVGFPERVSVKQQNSQSSHLLVTH